ncbi:Zn-ribbon domain-containing OB-fold protein [Croceicoccus sp. BE223]|uniref:Zn-ribbon domain-containing OB-fold protein n=1 Tax=Croceicoccus sp. BE223 TaxID=2817716 RepID=UPI00285EB531|nr:Zn-ribbon domain-containing OB-fold protein [Croceicoccus sp. BE223]MDR7103706.1 putative OB-fold protein [Croceicoccus sp. BE223]
MTQTLRNSPPRRYLPVIEEGARGEFWRCGADGVLRITRCQSCGHYIHPHRDACPQCHSRDVTPEAVSGKGTLETWTVNRQKWFRGLDEPFAVGAVTLDEQAGLNLTTNIVNCDLDALSIGMKVRVVFENIEDTWLALFEPDTAKQ